MDQEDRLRLLHDCQTPIRADKGTAYPCSQRDLDGYVKFYRTNKDIAYVSPNSGTNKLIIWLDINQKPDPESTAALERLGKGLKIRPWGPDLVIKAFKDLDTAFFMGTLTGNVLVRWKKVRDISNLWGFGSSHGVLWGYTSKMGHGQAQITINSTPHFKVASDPYREMWRTLLHEMCYAVTAITRRGRQRRAHRSAVTGFISDDAFTLSIGERTNIWD
ncbi:hypothetical protein MMC22_008366 [Lobaria immixta]|nr:hypothetical protein [Lobaria immixta]